MNSKCPLMPEGASKGRLPTGAAPTGHDGRSDAPAGPSRPCPKLMELIDTRAEACKMGFGFWLSVVLFLPALTYQIVLIVWAMKGAEEGGSERGAGAGADWAEPNLPSLPGPGEAEGTVDPSLDAPSHSGTRPRSCSRPSPDRVHCARRTPVSERRAASDRGAQGSSGPQRSPARAADL